MKNIYQQKEEEKQHFNLFKNLFTAFKIENEVHDDKPDFTFINDGKLIGVELANFYRDLTLHSASKSKQLEVSRDRLGDGLVEELKKFADKPFSLGVIFRDSHPIMPNKRKHLIDEWIPDCAEFILNNNRASYRIENHYQEGCWRYSAEILSVSLTVWPSMKHTFYNQNEGGLMPDLEYNQIQPLLLKHHEGLKKYKCCDEQWFVIFQGGRYSNWFDEVKIEKPITSDFDKVFILRDLRKELIELK